jgi:hypothetical protein
MRRRYRANREADPGSAKTPVGANLVSHRRRAVRLPHAASRSEQAEAGSPLSRNGRPAMLRCPVLLAESAWVASGVGERGGAPAEVALVRARARRWRASWVLPTVHPADDLLRGDPSGFGGRRCWRSPGSRPTRRDSDPSADARGRWAACRSAAHRPLSAGVLAADPRCGLFCLWPERGESGITDRACRGGRPHTIEVATGTTV